MNLTKTMKEKKITSKKLAEMTGINLRTIEDYRQERIEPSVKKGLIIANALGVDPYELYGVKKGK